MKYSYFILVHEIATRIICDVAVTYCLTIISSAWSLCCYFPHIYFL